MLTALSNFIFGRNAEASSAVHTGVLSHVSSGVQAQAHQPLEGDSIAAQGQQHDRSHSETIGASNVEAANAEGAKDEAKSVEDEEPAQGSKDSQASDAEKNVDTEKSVDAEKSAEASPPHGIDVSKINFGALTPEQNEILKKLAPAGEQGKPGDPGQPGKQGGKGDSKAAIGWGVGTAAATSLVGLGGLLWAQSSANKTQDKKLALLANQIQQSQQQ